jgi:hypothetical protein
MLHRGMQIPPEGTGIMPALELPSFKKDIGRQKFERQCVANKNPAGL